MDDARGAFVISLDFELHWGVRDHYPVNGAYTANLLGARRAVPRMLDLFEEYGVGATWATVGFLFARDRDELVTAWPHVRPRYVNAALDPYAEDVGPDEQRDPLHYAPSLIEVIRSYPHQEVGTHTFSHYYCREPGQSKEMFEADLRSAIAIAAERGIVLRSLVFPRNQVNVDYLDVLPRLGIRAYRSNQERKLHADPWERGGRVRRAARLLDDYASFLPDNLARWDALRAAPGLCRVPASFFLQPYARGRASLDPLRAARLGRAVRAAAAGGQLFHVWWHPHNFGTHLDENLRFLRRLLDVFRRCSEEQGMESLTMDEVAVRVLAGEREPS